MRAILTIFLTIFIAELGDKTQLATMLFASDREAKPLMVFAASAGALVLGAAISVAIGTVASRYLQHVPMKLIAGIGFILVGIWAIADYYRGGA